nr:Tn3 family transposase [Streptomyces cadmiisoli]
MRRFTRGGPRHPTYQAPQGLGRAVRAIFACNSIAGRPARRNLRRQKSVEGLWLALLRSCGRPRDSGATSGTCL